MFKALVEKEKNTKLGPQDTIRKFLKRKCLKCPRIVHLDLICMSWSALNWPINIHLIIASSNTPQMFLECTQLTNIHTSNSYYKLKNTFTNKLPRLHLIGQ
jgi:hypothetical protein